MNISSARNMIGLNPYRQNIVPIFIDWNKQKGQCKWGQNIAKNKRSAGLHLMGFNTAIM